MKILAISMAVLLPWAFCAVQLSLLRQRGWRREFWTSIGLLLIGSAVCLLVGLGVRLPSLVRLLTGWIWIP